jgi:hypothetical protein
MATTKKTKDKKEPAVVHTVVEDGETKPAELEPPKLDPPPAPKKEAEVVAKKEAEPTQRTGLLKITARQYIQAKGIRWERAAGFLHWATSNLGAGHLLTVPEWTKVHEGFNSTPVGR